MCLFLQFWKYSRKTSSHTKKAAILCVLIIIVVGIQTKNRKLVEQMVSQVEGMFDRMHVLVIGPGLGRCPLVLQSTAEIIRRARKANLPMVLDADGLFLLTQPETRNILTGYKRVVLTPNVAEYGRLLHSLRDDDDGRDGTQPQLSTLEKLLEGNVIVKKGQYDEISSVVQSVHDGVSSVKRYDMVCEELGGLKRSGGIGDVLAGTLGTFVAWHSILSSKEEDDEALGKNNMDAQDRLVLACWSACCVVKRATNYAFQEKRRSMTAPDVLDTVGKAMDNMTFSSIQQDKE
jgi:ATP-dependent NAD(P)H-hydrate dehydratase